VNANKEDILPSGTAVLSLAPLVGDRVVVLHSPSDAEEGLSGRDVDCAVTGLDPLWPLRLESGWRLCHFSQYDLRGWAWILERGGEFGYLDALDDPRGLGREGFATAFLKWDESVAAPALQAAYLAMKRLRKGTRMQPEWARIRSLAAEDWEAFRSVLDAAAGPRLGRLLYEVVRDGGALDNRLWRKARVLQVVRRFRTPSRAAAASFLQARRVLDRLVHPSGWSVLIVGPDGSGKSTLARTLVDSLGGVFRSHATFHWRPGLLPRPGAVVGRAEADPTTPHARSSHGLILSVTLLFYYWLDFLLGGWLRVWPARLRTRLVVTERGWWDLAVDPRRYRLDVSPRLVRALGTLLPHPDVALVLEAPPKVVLARKAELPESEIDRQSAAWRENLPPRLRAIPLDASLPAHAVAEKTREESLRVLETRAARRLGAGWVEVHLKGELRWWLPRGSSAVAAKALSVYQPVTVRGRVAWEAAGLAARAGGFRLLRRGEAPPLLVREALASHLPPRSTLAVGRANHPGRYVAAIVDRAGSCHGIAKVATGPAGVEALRTEAEAIETFGSLLSPPLAAPRILVNEPGVLLLEAVPWRPRLRPWRLERDVAGALGALFRSKAREDGVRLGPAHGDCAPWNLLQTEEGWVLIDWESASGEATPFYDLCHYVIQGHTLLGRPSWKEVRAGFLHRTGWVGAAVRAYAEGAEVPADEAVSFLEAYLRASGSRMEAEGERAGGVVRSRLLREIAG
jgi:thymidylate kinase